MANYAVGDIQGCYTQLVQLLDKVNFDPASDRLWSVGDLVNRGPKSLKTLRLLKSLGNSFTCVLGNHDLYFLSLAKGAYTKGNQKYLKKLLEAPDCEEICDWLIRFPLLHHETLDTNKGKEQFIMIHAGLAPGWTLKKAQALSAEVSEALNDDRQFKFLKKMYGNDPDIWHDSLTGMKRLRIITNYFTRIRFCNKDSQLNLAIKTGPNTAPKGYYPWFELTPLKEKMTILFGHWASLDGITHCDNVYALDTGCVWGRCMTALRLEDRKFFSVNCC